MRFSGQRIGKNDRARIQETLEADVKINDEKTAFPLSIIKYRSCRKKYTAISKEAERTLFACLLTARQYDASIKYKKPA